MEKSIEDKQKRQCDVCQTPLRWLKDVKGKWYPECLPKHPTNDNQVAAKLHKDANSSNSMIIDGNPSYDLKYDPKADIEDLRESIKGLEVGQVVVIAMLKDIKGAVK